VVTAAGGTTASDPAVEVRSLLVERGGRQVLHGISLEVTRGTVTGLLGPSGSGKTTLMRSIVGVQRVAGGEARVLGLPAGTPALRTRVGYVTQAPSVYPDLTVRENIRFFARVNRVPASRADEPIHTVDLDEHADQLVGSLSGGERARVSLAAALVGAPEVLVLDEPTVGLDPVLRRDLWETFHRLAAAGRTLLVSSHVMDEAERCDRLILLREGRILAISTPEALRGMTGTGDLNAAFLALIERPS
jgi:ABC-2 type transport system ATP-binding protein